MGRTACTEPQCLYKVALYFTLAFKIGKRAFFPIAQQLIVGQDLLNIEALLCHLTHHTQ